MRSLMFGTALAILATIHHQQFTAHAASTINSTNHHAWSGNTGWVDFRPERPNAGDGFKFGEFSCGGWLWSPNIGWINCGNGAPANGVQYANDTSTDFGVNHTGTGDLHGLAWAPNIGWINFGWSYLEPTNSARPRVNLATGEGTLAFEWTGGSIGGRFENATGATTWQVSVNPDLTYTAVADGVISY